MQIHQTATFDLLQLKESLAKLDFEIEAAEKKQIDETAIHNFTPTKKPCSKNKMVKMPPVKEKTMQGCDGIFTQKVNNYKGSKR